MSNPVFSIILPMYNVEKYLDKCIQSILAQTFSDFELICIDDASTDNTLNIINTYAEKDSRIKIIENSQNKRQGACRNLGLEVAKGKYLCSFDSDDWLETNLLEKVYNAFENNNVDSVWFRIWQYLDSREELRELSICNNKAMPEPEEGLLNINEKNLFDYVLYPWNKAFRMDFVKKNKIIWLPNVSYDDVYFYAKFYMLSKEIYIIPERLYYYRRRNNSVIGAANNQLSRDNEMYTTLLETYKLILSNSEFEVYKDCIITAGKRYKKQIQRQAYTPFIEFEYKKFLNNIEQLEAEYKS